MYAFTDFFEKEKSEKVCEKIFKKVQIQFLSQSSIKTLTKEQFLSHNQIICQPKDLKVGGEGPPQKYSWDLKL